MYMFRIPFSVVLGYQIYSLYAIVDIDFVGVVDIEESIDIDRPFKIGYYTPFL